VEELRDRGYTIKDACNALGISRSGYYSAKKAKEVGIKERIPEDEGLLGDAEAVLGYRHDEVHGVSDWMGISCDSA
jgi:hypothetical protein